MARKAIHGLFPELFSDALERHAKLALRSEKHGHYLDLAAQNIGLDALRNPDWQVIFGRRGTGKTFLLGSLGETVMRAFAQDREIALKVTLQDCLVSPVGREVPDRLRALGYFQVFVETLAEQLFAVISERLEQPTFLGVVTGQQKRRVAAIEHVMLEMLVMAQEGLPVAAFSEQKHKSESEHTESHELSAGLAAETRLALSSASAKAGGSAKATARQQTQNRRLRTVVSQTVPRYALIRKHLLQLMELADIRQLYILLDEWSALDPTASTAIQPEFADLLKRTLGGSEKITVKIATNRYQTRLSNKGAGTSYKGLEINADIFEAVNLDHAFSNDEDLVSFYTKLLYKRLRFCAPKLGVFSEARGADPDNGLPGSAFIDSMFASRESFLELVRGAAGIPRDFIILVNDVARRHNHLVKPRWKPSVVRQAVREKSVVTKQAEVDFQSEADQLLNGCIRDLALNMGSRVFFIDAGGVQAVQTTLDELLEKRLIHELPTLCMSQEIRRDFRGYIVDYGVYLDWASALEKGTATGHDLYSLEITDAGEAQRLVVDCTTVNKTLVTCQHCHARFPHDARPYVLRGLCTECYLPADGSGLPIAERTTPPEEDPKTNVTIDATAAAVRSV